MKKSHNIFFTKNSELSIEFSKYVMENPDMDDLLGEERIIIFLPEYDPGLMNFNIGLAKDIEAEGGKVLYVKVKAISPKVSSRLVGVEVSPKIAHG